MTKCKIFIEEITAHYNAHLNVFKKPSLGQDKYRVVKQSSKGFNVISSHINKSEALRKVKSMKGCKN